MFFLLRFPFFTLHSNKTNEKSIIFFIYLEHFFLYLKTDSGAATLFLTDFFAFLLPPFVFYWIKKSLLLIILWVMFVPSSSFFSSTKVSERDRDRNHPTTNNSCIALCMCAVLHTLTVHEHHVQLLHQQK